MKHLKSIALIAAGSSLAACGGGSVTSSTNLTIGSEGLVATNGLAFATVETEITNLAGKSVAMPFVYAVYNPETETSSLLFSDANAEFAADFFEAEAPEVTVTFDGETIVFSDGSGELGSGSVEFYLYDEDIYGSMVNFYGTMDDGTDFDGMSVVGFETDPATIAGLASNVTYIGYGEGWGNFLDTSGAIDESLSSITLDVTIAADFANKTIDGSMVTTDLYAYSDVDTTISPEATFAFNTDLVGNGFDADMTVSCDSGITCTGGGSLGGVFFGPEAEEAGGIFTIETTLTDPGYTEGAIRNEHPGAFYLSESIPE